MKKAKTILRIVLLLIVLGGSAWGYSFYYQSTHYFITEDARISAKMVTITPEITGKLTAWSAQEGDQVKVDQVLGIQDVSMLLSSNVINPSALTASADSIISKAEIKAPINGEVIQTDVVEGQVLAPGMNAAVIADTDHVYIEANVEETEIFKIKEGQLVEIMVDAHGKKPFKGYVETIGQATESVFSVFPTLNTSGDFTKQTQLIAVKISIVNDDHVELMPGMNTRVKIHIQ